MPSYKLFYFQSRGAAEVSRLVFRVAGVEFEDVRYTRDEWQGIKSDMPLEAMPVLEVDGKKFCQSNAIARYLAKTFDLMGSSATEAFIIDELNEVASEIFNRHMMKIYYEQEEDKKKEIAATFLKDNFPNYAKFIENRLNENTSGSGFYVGKSISLGDIILYHILYVLKHWFGSMGLDALADRPQLTAFFEKLDSYPQIAEWNKVGHTTVL